MTDKCILDRLYRERYRGLADLYRALDDAVPQMGPPILKMGLDFDGLDEAVLTWRLPNGREVQLAQSQGDDYVYYDVAGYYGQWRGRPRDAYLIIGEVRGHYEME
jgi:hypothetical protein